MEDTFDGRNREHSNHYLQGFSIIPGSLGFLNHQRILPFPPQEKNQKFPAFTRPDFIALRHGLVRLQMGPQLRICSMSFFGHPKMVVL